MSEPIRITIQLLGMPNEMRNDLIEQVFKAIEAAICNGNINPVLSIKVE